MLSIAIFIIKAVFAVIACYAIVGLFLMLVFSIIATIKKDVNQWSK